MAILHIVRCDGDTCTAEAPLSCNASTQGFIYANQGLNMQTSNVLPSTSYSVPSSWPEVDGRQFCSYRCLADFADAKAKAQGSMG